jgi:enoyl-[acyl-carrier-protein] reductase (NADH)
MSSLGVTSIGPGYGMMAASKAALEATIRQLSVELGESNITANSITTFAVDTESLQHFPERVELIKSAQNSPLKRGIKEEDISNACLFLCSPLSSMITGQTIVVDGGWSVKALR